MQKSIGWMIFIGIVGFTSFVKAEFPVASSLPSQSSLPDPLVKLDGSRTTTPLDWKAHRRPELKSLFEHYMYGKAPVANQIVVVQENENKEALGGKATWKEIGIKVGPKQDLTIHLLLVVPNQRTAPVPVFLGTSFYGTQTVLNDPKIHLSTNWMPDRAPGCIKNRATDASRGTAVDVWAIEQSIDRGYAVAVFYCGDVAPDHPGKSDGVFPLYRKAGEPKPASDEWGAVAAWAWGLSRVIDYLESDSNIDKNKIAVVGHSRLGKAATLAAAFDERISLVISHQAGCGGTAPSRGTIGESVKAINDRFPHWFCDEFKTFNTQTDRLPFDQNCLFALVAPRPLLLTNAVDDQWANPTGQFDALKASSSVYQLLGVEGLNAKSMPEIGVLIDSRLGYHIRPGKHSMGLEDWPTFWKFAEKHFKHSAH
jgi:hypothetical protein